MSTVFEEENVSILFIKFFPYIIIIIIIPIIKRNNDYTCTIKLVFVEQKCRMNNIETMSKKWQIILLSRWKLVIILCSK